ncbi:MAG: hypothetical protein U0R19_36830 [Bryobacteraceae bacterium]
MRIVWMMLLLCHCSWAEWTRVVSTVYGESRDSAAPRPLEYFQLDALLRDDRAAEMCARCSVAEKVAMRKKYGVEARVRVVGEVGGVTISDVWNCPVGEADEKCGAKSIVARTKEGYREILYTTLRQMDGRLNASFVANAGKERVLGSRDFVGGNRGIHVEHYFWFDAEGARLMDLSPVWEAAKSVVLPGGLRLYGADFGGPRSFPAGRVRVPLREIGAALCCAEGGVEVDFRLERGRLIPTGKRFVAK